MYQVYIWSGKKHEALRGFYSDALYVVGAESREEAIEKLVKSQTIDYVQHRMKLINTIKSRISELENGAKSEWENGIELDRCLANLAAYGKSTISELMENQECEKNGYLKSLTRMSQMWYILRT